MTVSNNPINFNLRFSSSNTTKISNNNEINSTNTTNDNNTVFGYKIDKDGYFTEELNKAAGIPADFKIHSDTIKSLVNVKTNKDNPMRSFKSIDIAKTIGNAYKILSQVVGEDTLN